MPASMHMYEIQNIRVAFNMSCPRTKKNIFIIIIIIFTSQNTGCLFALQLLEAEV